MNRPIEVNAEYIPQEDLLKYIVKEGPIKKLFNVTHRIVVVHGSTGTGKTMILRTLETEVNETTKKTGVYAVYINLASVPHESGEIENTLLVNIIYGIKQQKSKWKWIKDNWKEIIKAIGNFLSNSSLSININIKQDLENIEERIESLEEEIDALKEGKEKRNLNLLGFQGFLKNMSESIKINKFLFLIDGFTDFCLNNKLNETDSKETLKIINRLRSGEVGGRFSSQVIVTGYPSILDYLRKLEIMNSHRTIIDLNWNFTQIDEFKDFIKKVLDNYDVSINTRLLNPIAIYSNLNIRRALNMVNQLADSEDTNTLRKNIADDYKTNNWDMFDDKVKKLIKKVVYVDTDKSLATQVTFDGPFATQIRNKFDKLRNLADRIFSSDNDSTPFLLVDPKEHRYDIDKRLILMLYRYSEEILGTKRLLCPIDESHLEGSKQNTPKYQHEISIDSKRITL
ncbi:MAG: hypothetical protein GYA24_18140 [Candidatus Lokiarchaeota archaeon]|nr:hypothetical protein [Candidatus Lokiarchaeota archaeon]